MGDGSARCSVDLDCDDGVYCNGAERCAPGNADADGDGCVSGSRPCGEAEGCDEASRTCVECPDADGDGYADAACGGTDCDDTDPGVNPGAVEICDAEGRDEDCDPSTLGHDLDGDGQVADHCCNRRGDGVLLCGTDCNDAVRSVYAGASEICNGYDDDCDGRLDEGVLLDGFVDDDRDGHGDPERPLRACPGVAGFSTIGDDCDDTDRDVHPGRGEGCNGVDDDCDGAIDENVIALTWYRDRDGDGFGDPRGATQTGCAQPEGYALLPFDCDDDDAEIHPAAEERCNAIDDDCDGFPGFVVAPGDYEDDDRDGYPDAACADDEAVADCDDRDYRVNPGAREIVGDGVDNNCDGSADDRCVMTAWYVDADGDGYGAGAPTLSCEPIAGSVTRDGDCDDEDPEIRPSATEICNGIDDDCDGRIDELTAPRCVYPNALGLCAEGTCAIGVCAAGFLDCGAGAGCEASASAVGTCGACDVACDAVDAPRASAACLPRAGSPAFVCGVSCDVGWGDCDGEVTNGCETDIFENVDQCGGCGIGFRCDIPDNASATCTGGRCGILCDFGYESCDGDEGTGCETRVGSDPDNCGMCGRACAPDAPICSDGRCVANPFPPTGASEHFAPTEDVVLTPGIHRYLSIHIPAGVRVTTSGTAVLDLRAEGDVIIEGSIDLSGGDGGNQGNLRIPTGGATGDPLSPGLTITYPNPNQCGPALGGSGSPGGNAPASEMSGMAGCGYGGTNGGGQPATAGGGGGGGGFAGGGGGAHYNASTTVLRPGGDGGGAGGGPGGDAVDALAGRGGVAPAPYGGGTGGATATVGAGGGGSIGSAAAADLEVRTTFRPGSAGGAGGHGSSWVGAGAGGGGALRVSSGTRVVLQGGSLLARGGVGGRATNSGTGGGGGSGGVIYVAAPEVDLASGTVDARGGNGGAAPSPGGAGGLGRIRLSVDPLWCNINAVTTPPTACDDGVATPGRGYVGRYPN